MKNTAAAVLLTLLSGPALPLQYCSTEYPPTVPQRTQQSPIEADVGLFLVERDIDIGDQSRVIAASRKLEGAYRSLGLDVRVSAHALEAECTNGLYGTCFDEILQIGDYSHYHLWSGYGDACGRGQILGTRAWTSVLCGYETLVHEQGHNFGLWHSGIDGGWQYGWKTWMGAGNRADKFAQPHAAQLMLDEKSAVGPGSYFLTSSYDDPLAAEHQAVHFGEFTVSTWRGAVTVSRTETHLWQVARLSPSEVVRVDGMNVEYVSKQDGVAHVRIGESVDTAAADQQFPQPEPVDYADGLYHDPKATHQGVMVMGQVIYWMTWNKSLEPLWYIGIDGVLYRAEKKSDGVSLADAGSYTLTERGLRYATPVLGRGLAPMELLSDAGDGQLTGHWDIGGGRGLVLQSDGERLFGYLLTYGSTPSPLHPNPADLEWYLVVGPVGGELKIWNPMQGYPGVDLTPLVGLEDTTRIENGVWMRDGSPLIRVQ